MTKCSFGIVTSSPRPSRCALLRGVRESTYVSLPSMRHVHAGSLPPPEEQRPGMPAAPVPLPSKAELRRGGMVEVKPEKSANICVHLGPNLSPTENAHNNFHWLREPLDQALRAAAPMALFTILVGLHGNGRVLSSENRVLAQAC